jgi:taurine dioxygenase
MPVHPLIRTHPVTHKKAIYVHPGKLENLVDMEAHDSHALICNLLNKVITPKITYRHKWREGDLLIADNRAVLHLAHQDYDLSEGRIMYRVLIKGERPI